MIVIRHCNGCESNVVPIRLFNRSPQTNKGYFVWQCPKDRCKFNIDLEEYEPPKNLPPDDDKGRIFWKDIFR